MARKKRRQRPIPEIEIIETLQPAPAGLDLAASWYLVWTAPRGEAKAAASLSEAGCQVFWPHFQRITRRKNKPEISNMVSTYPRYLFASGLPSLARRLTIVGADGRSGVTIDGRPIDDIRQIEGVVGVVSNSSGWCRVPGAAIAHVIAHQGAEQSSEPLQDRRLLLLTPGSRVSIIEGPFMGFMATVVESLGQEAARVLIDIFGRETSAEFDIAQIEAA